MSNETDWMSIIEGLLFVSPTPVSVEKLKAVLGSLTLSEIRDYLRRLQSVYEERRSALEVREIAGGFQIYTRPEFASWIGKLIENRPARLSCPALETLAIIAYKQPTSRAEIESVRGVDSQKAIRTLLERGLIRVLGRKDVAGRPLLYGTTKRFLDHFGLKDLSSLPSRTELEEMDLGKEA